MIKASATVEQQVCPFLFNLYHPLALQIRLALICGEPVGFLEPGFAHPCDALIDWCLVCTLHGLSTAWFCVCVICVTLAIVRAALARRINGKNRRVGVTIAICAGTRLSFSLLR